IFYFAWSLATEEQFYLFWPLIVATSRSVRGLAITMACLMAGAVLARFLQLHGFVGSDPLAWKAIASISPSICLGCLCALLVSEERGFRAVAPLLAQPWAPVALLAALLSAIEWLGGGLVVSALMALLVTSCCIAPRHWG